MPIESEAEVWAPQELVESGQEIEIAENQATINSNQANAKRLFD
jgi:hypothetical protein